MTCDGSSLPMTCDVLSFNIVRKSLQFFHIGNQLKMFHLKNTRMLLTHVHLWKTLYFKGHHKYPQFIMGEEPFWNIEISWSQWEGSACTQSALIFLISGLGQGRGVVGDFFHFSFVPNMFVSSSQYVP
jgi:hypothetical protein